MKKLLMLSIVAILVSSCGPRRPGKVGAPGLNGANGNDGTNGTNGQDGYSLVVDVQPFVMIGYTGACNKTDMYQDRDRNNSFSFGDLFQGSFITCNGLDGNDGNDGGDGESAYQIALAHGFVGSESDWLDSLQGADGQDGQSIIGPQGPQGIPGTNAPLTYSIVQVIDPCGTQHPNGYDEVILKLGNGQYLASFSDNANGLNTRFGLLPPGNYVTTDGTNCHFNIP